MSAVTAPRPATPPSRIAKRDGTQVPFDAERIYSAILRAGQATGEFAEDEARLLTAQVVKFVSHRFSAEEPPTI